MNVREQKFLEVADECFVDVTNEVFNKPDPWLHDIDLLRVLVAVDPAANIGHPQMRTGKNIGTAYRRASDALPSFAARRELRGTQPLEWVQQRRKDGATHRARVRALLVAFVLALAAPARAGEARFLPSLAHAKAGGTVWMGLMLTSSHQALGYDATVAYEPGVLSVVSTKTSGVLRGCLDLESVLPKKPGELRVALACPDGSSGGGVGIQFRVSPEAAAGSKFAVAPRCAIDDGREPCVGVTGVVAVDP